MGCDIHSWVEVEVDDKWVAIQPIDDNSIMHSRNYLWFDILAGVRHTAAHNVLHGIPKGLPKDVSDTVRYLYDSDDYHSHSFFSLKELGILYEAHKGMLLQDSDIDYFAGIPQHLTLPTIWDRFGDNKNEREYRIVFCFDS